MNQNFIIPLLNIVVSIFAVFLSNYLGRKSAVEKLSNGQKLKSYQEFYVPLIKKLYNVKSEKWNFYDLITDSTENGKTTYDELSDLFFSKMEYMATDLPPLVIQLELMASDTKSNVSLSLYSKLSGAPSIEDSAKQVETANNLLDQIIIGSLKHATKLANKLSLEPIAQPLLNTYLDEKNHRTKFLSRMQRVQKFGGII